MSLAARTGTRSAGLPATLARPRAFALAGGAVLSATYLSILYHVVDVVEEPGMVPFLAVVAGSVALAAASARRLRPRLAAGLAVALLGAGLGGYLLAVPAGAVAVEKLVVDSVRLLSGMTVLRITAAGVWAIGLAPAPLFLSWYYFGRRAYGAGALAGGAALGVFLLTADASVGLGLAGVLGGAAAVGFGQLDREGDAPALRNTLVLVLVVMLVVTTSASLVPGGAARPLDGSGGPTTIEASLTNADARVDVVGSITLSAQARFSVTASNSRYWRVGAYDRYTGDGWVRTGTTSPYSVFLESPSAIVTEPVQQTFVAESTVSTMPAAWKPMRFTSEDEEARVTELGGLQPVAPLQPGDRYSVLSITPATPERALRDAGPDYPPEIQARYLTLPASTPVRLERFTSELTADADSPYRKAEMIEAWLQSTKNYSLAVERPDGNVADVFVFEMDAGYCTYFATAMVAMLRTQGIPARFVVGYLPGDRVAEDQWLVRGFDSHAWVEVYFPETGWVQFDPTPAGPRQAVERSRLTRARQSGEPNVDTNASAAAGPESSQLPPASFGVIGEPANGTFTDLPANATVNGSSGGSASGPLEGLFGEEDGPSVESVLYALVLLAGAAVVLRRLAIVERGYRALWLRRMPGGPPVDRIEAAVERVEYLLGRRYRPREAGETRRAYLASLRRSRPGMDGRVVDLYRLGERARYGGRASEGEARRAAELLSELRAEFG